MALILQIEGTERTKCTEILITDATGDYDASSNPGGWGAPNITKGDVTTSELTITYPDASQLVLDVFVAPYEFPQTNSTMLFTPAANGATLVGTDISGATTASPIVITTSTAHGLSTDDYVFIVGVVGNTAANGYWQVTVLTTTTFQLNGSRGNGAWISGGYVWQNTSDQTTLPYGVYRFDLEVGDGVSTYTATDYHLHSCSVASCISRFSYRLNSQECCPTEDLQKFNQMQAWLQAAQNAMSNGQYTDANELMTRASDLCSNLMGDCGCGC